MVKVGIIGFGYMGHFHLNKIRAVSGAEAVVAFDTDPQSLREAREEGLRASDTLESFLKEDIRLVVIATPNDSHAKYAIACMKAGKNVMCEKPSTLDRASLETVMECARETGRLFTVHQNRRWDLDFLSVCETVRNGLIGNITTIDSTVLGQRGVCFGWRADPEAGGGMLYDWGVHLIDQMLQLFRDQTVTSVYGRMLSVLTPRVDDFFEATLKFSRGTCAHLTVSTFALQDKPRWYLYGDRGTMKLSAYNDEKVGGILRIRKEQINFESNFGKSTIGPSRTMAPLKPEMLEIVPLPVVKDESMVFWENLVSSVEGKAEPYVTGVDLLRQMDVLEAIVRSSKENQVVDTNI